MSRWNPIDSIKSAAEDVKDFGADAATTGKKLYDDAYDVGKTAVKGAGTVAKDTVHTAKDSASNLAEGDLGGATKAVVHGADQINTDLNNTKADVAKGVVHGLADAGKGAQKMGGDLHDLAIDSATAISPDAGKALRVGEAFGAAAINSAVLQPISGVTQLASAGVEKLTGHELGTLNLHLDVDTEGLGVAGKIASIAGTAAGYMAPMLLTGGATSAIAGIGMAGKAAESAVAVGDIAAASGKTAATVAGKTAEAATTAGKTAEAATTAGKTAEAGTSENASAVSSMASKFLDSPQKSTVDGALSGFIFTPGKDGEVDVRHRLEAGAVNAAAFGTMTATARKVHQAGESVAGPAVDSIGVVGATETVGRHTASGVTGGIASEETRSLIEGRGLAAPHQLVESANQMIVKDAAAASADKARVTVVGAVK